MKKEILDLLGSRALPILIFDKTGYIGNRLAEELHEVVPIYLVSSKKLVKTKKNITFIPCNNTVPAIPDHYYSHMFFIYNGEERVVDFFDDFSKKAERDKTTLLFLCKQNYFSRKIIHMVLQPYMHTYIFLFGELLGKETPDYLSGRSGAILKEAKETSKVTLPAMGTDNIQVATEDDVVEAMLEKAFSVDKPKRTFFFFPEYPIPELSLARILHKVHPNLTIDFASSVDKTIAKRKPSSAIEGKYALENPYPLEDRLKVSLKDEKWKEQKGDKHHLLRALIRKRFRQKKRSIKRLVIEGVLLALILPILATLVLFIVGGVFLFETKNSFNQGNFLQAKKESDIANTVFSFSSQTLSIDESIFGERLFEIPTATIQAAEDVATLVSQTANGLASFSSVVKGSSGSSQAIYQGIASLKETLAFYQQIQAEEKTNQAYTWVVIRMLGQETTVFDTLAQKNGSALLDALPQILGFNTPQKYLLLFQNNMELRPGGGFIGSYGITTLNNGKPSNFAIHDVYEADGHLKGHIEPPFALRRYVPIVHWYLRDSNFDIDYPKNASEAAYFLQQEQNQDVDGVIAIDVSFVKNIVQALGSVNVPDYHEVVTADNFYLLTEKHAEKNFFPGSSQKKDFLESLFNAIEVKLQNEKAKQYKTLLEAVNAALSEKHMLVAFSDSALEQLMIANHFAGSLHDERNQNAGGVLDTFGVNDANIGADKANYFLKRQIEQYITIGQQGDIAEKAIIRYFNGSTSWPGGAYKNFVRFILPQNADLTSIVIDGEQQAVIPAITDPLIYEKKGFVKPAGLEVQQYDEDGKTVYGFFTTVPPGKVQTIAITYTLSQKLALNQGMATYALRVIKQPGTLDDPYLLSVSYPSNLSVQGVPEGFEQLPGMIHGVVALQSDYDSSLTFTKR